MVDIHKTHTGKCIVVKFITGNYQSYPVIIHNYPKNGQRETSWQELVLILSVNIFRVLVNVITTYISLFLLCSVFPKHSRIEEVSYPAICFLKLTFLSLPFQMQWPVSSSVASILIMSDFKQVSYRSYYRKLAFPLLFLAIHTHLVPVRVACWWQQCQYGCHTCYEWTFLQRPNLDASRQM
jgi:hypothetical protein